MPRRNIHQPDEAAMLRLLQDNVQNTAGTILRLAWLQGLTREEICALTWDQVSFAEQQINLPDRNVPIDAEMQMYLQTAYNVRDESCDFVLWSQKTRGPFQPESISNLLRRTLNSEGLTDVRLTDLRYDWILRQLETQDWATVARISGLEIRWLQENFNPLLKNTPPKAQRNRESGIHIDEYKLWKILQAEKDSPAGIALWLSSQMGLTNQEVIELTWDKINFADCEVRLPDRTVPITNTLLRLLTNLYSSRPQNADPHVLLSPRAQKPIDQARLSRLTRTVLIRGGLKDVQMQDIRKRKQQYDENNTILNIAMAKGYVSRNAVCEKMGLTKSEAYHRLQRLVNQNKLVMIGTRYYLPNTVVVPEDHLSVIKDYIAREGGAYNKDLALLLGIDSRQCTTILKRFVDLGELEKRGPRYYLPTKSSKQKDQ